MGYIYRYTDCNDGIIKYVGIVWSNNRTLKQRIKEHEHDYWYSKGDWTIEYLEKDINSRTDAEYIESHLISLYHTNEWYNNTKSKWGISSYIDIDESDWKDFNYQDLNERICSLSVILSNEEYDKLLYMSKSYGQSCNSTIRHLINNSQNNNNYILNNMENYSIYISFDDMLKYYRTHPNTTTVFTSKLSINADICQQPQIFIYAFSLSDNIMSCKYQQQIDGETTEGVINYDISDNHKDLNIYTIAVPCRQVCTNDKDVVNYLIGHYSIELSQEKKKFDNILISDLFLKDKLNDVSYKIIGIENDNTYFYYKTDNSTVEISTNRILSTQEIGLNEFLKQYGMYYCINSNYREDYIHTLEEKIKRLSEFL